MFTKILLILIVIMNGLMLFMLYMANPDIVQDIKGGGDDNGLAEEKGAAPAESAGGNTGGSAVASTGPQSPGSSSKNAVEGINGGQNPGDPNTSSDPPAAVALLTSAGLASSLAGRPSLSGMRSGEIAGSGLTSHLFDNAQMDLMDPIVSKGK